MTGNSLSEAILFPSRSLTDSVWFMNQNDTAFSINTYLPGIWHMQHF